MRARRVAVIGGGFSGAAQAIALTRAGIATTLIERGERPGRGVAYGTRHADHLLNVRASGMSAFPDEADHFADWWKARGGSADQFAPRQVYGTYIEELLAKAQQEGLEIVAGEAVDVEPGEGVRLEGGRGIAADAVVLAVGNFPPDVPGVISRELQESSIYVADPWAEEIGSGLSDEDAVLLIGTGLTAVDAALMLDNAGFRGPIVALSRRGLKPRPHAVTPVNANGSCAAPERKLADLIRQVRSDADRIGWRAAVDRLRPATQHLWRSASEREQRRFLRHARPWWDVHRHRIAPAIAERIDGMEAEGRVRFSGGRIVSAERSGDGVDLEWRPRGGRDVERLRVARIVNCTGPKADISRAGEPLLDALIAGGKIRPDLLRLGIDVDASFRTVGANGNATRGLYAVGPLTRGAFWEIVAVPDIRVQVQQLARDLAAG